MSQNNSKIPSIISLIVLVLILAGVFFAVNRPKVEAPSNNNSNPSSIKTSTSSQLAANPADKCTPSQLPKSDQIKPVDLEQLKKITIEETKVGSGETVKSGDVICIDYKGTFVDGKVFDESYKRGKPFTTQIGVGQVIPGWDLGIVGLKEGGKRKLTIPSDLAYGPADRQGIPANSTLIFEVELVKIIK